MKKKTSKLLILGACAAMLTAGAAVALSNASPALLPAQGDADNYTMSLVRTADNYTADNVNNIYTTAGETSLGNPIYLRSNSAAEPSSGMVYMNKFTDSSSTTVGFYEDFDGTKLFKFQDLKSITITSNNNVDVKVQTSIDGMHWTVFKTVTATSSGEKVNFTSNPRFINLVSGDTRPTQNRFLTKIDFEYSCDSSYVDEVIYAGTYDYSTTARVVLNENKTGTIYYGVQSPTKQTDFTWEIVSETLLRFIVPEAETEKPYIFDTTEINVTIVLSYKAAYRLRISYTNKITTKIQNFDRV